MFSIPIISELGAPVGLLDARRVAYAVTLIGDG
jgi:hypothetical protein